jgi:penicillin-binding protein 1A
MAEKPQDGWPESGPERDRPSPPGHEGGRARARLRRWVSLLSFSFMALTIALGFLVFLLVPHLQKQIDNPQLLDQRAAMVLDADGKELATRGGRYADIVPLEEMPPYLIQAFLAAEDQRFYSHSGFDIRGILRAAWRNLQAGAFVEGGSTITQQLAKNLYLSSERTVARKFQEALITLWLESHYTKDEILSVYLNRIYLGAGTYGVEAASRFYFNKPVSDVTLAEAALLAGLPKAPSRFAPTNDLKRAQARADYVLQLLVETGSLTNGEVFAARAEPAEIVVREDRLGTHYFVDWILEEARALIPPADGTIIIRTTLDGAMQRKAEAAMEKALADQGPAVNIEQGALLTLARDGAVKAMVGGRSYLDSQFNRAAQAKRQPGSAFKPVIYLTALKNGFGPSSIMIDEPVDIHGWQPENSAGRYWGPVTLLTAFKHSLNTVAVRLTEQVGRGKVIETARQLGIKSPIAALPSLALGASEVTLVELTGAYLPFAADGKGAEPWGITEISTPSGIVLYERKEEPRQIISARRARDMTHMLHQVIAEGTGTRASLGRRMAAGKTGTSQNNRDAWFIGYTHQYVTGIWFGNDDSSPSAGASGGGIAASTWSAYMNDIHRGLPRIALPGVRREPVVARQGKEQEYFRQLSALFRSAPPVSAGRTTRFRQGGETIRVR